MISVVPQCRFVAFYSYKGGTLRTMSLAHAAWYLAHTCGLRVIAVDFDVEAPGLAYFFRSSYARQHSGDDLISRIWNTNGVAQWVLSSQATGSDEFDKWLIDVIPPGGRRGSLQLLGPGCMNAPDYQQRLALCNERLQGSKGPTVISRLRTALEKRADVVLVDVRTGITPSGTEVLAGLADCVVLCAGTNMQSLDGALTMAGSLRQYYQRRATREVPLWLLIGRASVDSHGFAEWRDRYGSLFGLAIEESSEESGVSGAPHARRVLNKTPVLWYGIQAFVIPHDPLCSFDETIFFDEPIQPMIMPVLSNLGEALAGWCLDAHAVRSIDEIQRLSLHLEDKEIVRLRTERVTAEAGLPPYTLGVLAIVELRRDVEALLGLHDYSGALFGIDRWLARVQTMESHPTLAPDAQSQWRQARAKLLDLREAVRSRMESSHRTLQRGDWSDVVDWTTRPVFENADCRGQRFIGADLSGFSFAGADLTGAMFHRANLNGANLQNAILVQADLRDASLLGARIDKATFLGARFRGARLVGAKWESWSPLREDDVVEQGGAPPEPLRYEPCVAPPGDVEIVVISPTGEEVVTGHRCGAVHIWDAFTGRPLRALVGHGAPIVALDFDQEGRRLVSASTDGTIRIWAAQSGVEVGHVLRTHPEARVTGAAIMPDGSGIVLAMSRPGQSTLEYVTSDGESAPAAGLNATVASSRERTFLKLTSDGQTLAAYDDSDGFTLRGVRPREARIEGAHRAYYRRGRVTSLAADRPGRRFAVADSVGEGDTIIWLLEDTPQRPGDPAHSGEDAPRLEPLELIRVQGEIESCAISSDGQLIVAGFHDGRLLSWRVEGKPMDTWSIRNNHPNPQGSALVGGVVRALAIHPEEGHALVAATADKQLLIGRWSADRDGTLHVSTTDLATPSVNVDRFDGATLTLTVSPRLTVLWHPFEGRVETRGSSAMDSAAQQETAQRVETMNPSSSRIARAHGSDIEIARNGMRAGLLRGHTGRVKSLVFSEDGALLFSSAEDGTVRLWDTLRGEWVRGLLVLPSRAWVLFAPDGRYHAHGRVEHAFWHAVGLARMETAETEVYTKLAQKDSMALAVTTSVETR